MTRSPFSAPEPRNPFAPPAPEPQDSLQDVVSGIVIFFAIFVAGLYCFGWA